MSEYIVAVDLGTSSCKTVVVDNNAKVVLIVHFLILPSSVQALYLQVLDARDCIMLAAHT